MLCLNFSMQNMQNICKKYAETWKKNAENMHEISRICTSLHILQIYALPARAHFAY